MTDLENSPLWQVLESANKILDEQQPVKNAGSDLIYKKIPLLLAKAEPSVFYQWFISAWQAMEWLHRQDVKEEEWVTVVSKMINSLMADVSGNPKLCAMCASYVFTSIEHHPLAQKYALRMIIQLTVSLQLWHDDKFYNWVATVMNSRIAAALEITDQRDIFIAVLIKFFANPAKYDHICISSLSKAFNTQPVQNFVKSKKIDESEKVLISTIASKAFTSALNSNCTFDYELVLDTPIIFDSLSVFQKKVLETLAGGSLSDLKELEKDLEGVNIQNLEENIRLLCVLELCRGKKSVKLEELQKVVGEGNSVPEIVIEANGSGAARLRIDGDLVRIEFSQARRFGDNEWNDVDARMDRVIASLKALKQ